MKVDVEFLNLIVYPFLAYFVLCSSYLLLLSIYSYFFTKHQSTSCAQTPRIAVLIPAHNEALGIVDCLRTIKQSEYPSELFQVFVIADHCTDDTAALASQEGVLVMERKDAEGGKGAALDWFLREYKEYYQGYEVIGFIDADTFVDPHFLKEIAKSFMDPQACAVQGYYGVSNPRDSWMTALSQVSLDLVHHLRPAGREALGGTVGLKGNGMAIRTDFLLEHGWPCHSLVEDLELTLYMLEKGELVRYNPDAIVLGEMPTSSKQAESQRMRWEGGRLELLKRWLPSLSFEWLTRWQFHYYDAIMDLCIPPLSLLLMLGLVLEFWAYLCAPTFFVTVLGALLGIVAYVVAGVLSKKRPLHAWLALLAAPFFLLFKLSLYAKMSLRKKATLGWVRTARNKEL